MTKKIFAWYDGACEPKNPGGTASYGFIIKDENSGVLYEDGKIVGTGAGMSNNVAEYSGLIAAMRWLLANNLNKDADIIFYGDNKMSVCQMNKQWRVHGGLYVPFYLEAMELKNQFKRLKFSWIPREQNSEADELSKTPMRQAGVIFRIQPDFSPPKLGTEAPAITGDNAAISRVSKP